MLHPAPCECQLPWEQGHGYNLQMLQRMLCIWRVGETERKKGRREGGGKGREEEREGRREGRRKEGKEGPLTCHGIALGQVPPSRE